MCGIAGIFNLTPQEPPAEFQLRRMLGTIRHRGPDQFGILLNPIAALGSARLSIIDLSSGRQPICNEDKSLWIVYNGEVFNYIELREDLERRGHVFVTRSDTEVIVHAYEEYGPGCLSRFNGQFAFALLDLKKKQLFLARDRVGVRPLFYAVTQGQLVFGSEAKELLTHPRLSAELDPRVLEEIFVFWCSGSSRSIFKGIEELPPGSYMIADGSGIKIERWWEMSFDSTSSKPLGLKADDVDGWADALSERLTQATRLRLRADVPVGAYLSGGLDSSIISALVCKIHAPKLHTFSISFTNPDFDERQFQIEVAKALDTHHTAIEIRHEDIGAAFPRVIWHAETPLTRTSPVPLFLLSAQVQASRLKVVLTGEGADEFLGGYDIFKEDRVRRFWARSPDSKWRWHLLRRLYEDIPAMTKLSPSYLAKFFQDGLTDTHLPYYSHWIRWRNNQRCCRFFSPELQSRLSVEKRRLWDQLEPPAAMKNWGALERAQYWEIHLFLSRYLLSSQGDRVAMAHSVEGRFPFLDQHVLELCKQAPTGLKLRGLTEKFLLRRALGSLIPKDIAQRRKRPYRAPIHRSFFHAQTPAYVKELLSPEAIERSGYFQPSAVAQLVARVENGRPLGETDDMAVAGILSTQLLHHQYVTRFQPPPPLSSSEDVGVIQT
ncbi:MAG: asparagine synthase (glutamine-hydrolyzing) [Verrucomicrobia bacterium]|nr:asparagine synthase (glutamine-hydrolyzing) [Verrucomicrobiota bacterium]MBI3870804.1 asparagine synthase (glutamine-hydrolyzing) [Verrucomicrobiota bacterium]